MRDPYDVLGVDRRAGEKEIKSAFRKLAKKHHPDQNPGDKRAQERFAEVNQAYEIVGDKTKRAKFDRGEIDAEGKDKFAFNGFCGEGGSPFGAGSPFGQRRGGERTGGFRFTRGGRGGAAEDILNEFFGGGFGGSRPGGANAGGPNAGGAGMGGAGMGGAGMGGEAFEASRARAARKGADVETEVRVGIDEVMAGEKATAVLPDGRRLAVTLPVGVREGQVIRLRGQGETGAGGAKGDALVTVRFAPHPLYRVDGDHLRVALEVPLEDAVLGAKLPVATPGGRVAVTVPPMTSSDKVFRLRGRGLPLDAKGRRGDLMVDVRIMLGEDADGRLAALMRERRAAKEG